MDDQLGQAAPANHRHPRPGKVSVTPTKGMSSQRGLALAYSPGAALLGDPARPAERGVNRCVQWGDDNDKPSSIAC
jgi:malate dehydrogenase (oxaloacetate-decarboxylating)(NADP+)